MPIKSFYTLGHPTPTFQAEAVVFDGSNDNLDKSGNLTGVSDGKVHTWSCLLRPVLAAAEWFWYNHVGNIRFGLQVTTAGYVRQYARQAGTTTVVLNQYSNGGTKQFSANEWVHVMGCADTSDSNKCLIYVNGISEGGAATVVNANMEFTPTQWKIASKASDDVRYGGEMSELWWDDSYIDLSVQSNREKFISGTGTGATPVDLGSDGSTPTGASPGLYFSGDASVWNAGTNSGAGGNFTMVGAVTDSTNEPVEAD